MLKRLDKMTEADFARLVTEFSGFEMPNFREIEQRHRVSLGLPAQREVTEGSKPKS